MKDIAALLHDQPFTDGLSEAMVEQIAGCAKNERFEQGSYIFKEGSSADNFYIIRHGVVALESNLPAGNPVIFLTLGEGKLLGSAWLVPPYRWGYDARALETTVGISFDAVCLRTKCENDHSLGYALMKKFVPVLVERLQLARLQSADVFAPPKRPD